ncbi:LamB/YcsF family protein [Klebsiella pneumoniae]|nr:LamB/YcsF family protein [Klebsiella pneumoniae]
MNTIDINSDLGESFGQWHMGDDARMLTVVSSANIACGFHAGDPAGMRATLKAAAANQVCCGAHVGYPDIQGFGRREMNMADDDLTASVIYQIGALAGLARAAGTRVSYVKPHGALYNTIAHDRRQGMAVINAIKDYNASLPLVVLAGSPLAQLAREQGLQVVAEAFADRAYHQDGTLVSRREAGAVLHDTQAIASRMVQLVREGGVVSVESVFTPISAQSICVHGDSPGAVEMAIKVRAALEEEGIQIAPFCPGEQQ